MSKLAKFCTFCISLILILVLSTGTPARKGPSGRPNNNYKWFNSFVNNFYIKPQAITASTSSLAVNTNADNPPLQDQVEMIPEVKGIYLTGWMTGNTTAFKEIVAFVNRTEVNALVIDVKDDTGTISYASQVLLAQQTGSSRQKFDAKKVLTTLKSNNIYPIARIVVFKDPWLAGHRTDLAVRCTQGGLWRDYNGLYWVDPYNKAVWDYNIAIAKEAAQMGFKEIQFDYVRFTSDGLIKYCQYPAADNRVKSDVIRDFLKYAYQELNPLGVKVSADLFGLTCTARDDLGIGQVLEKVAEGVDVICPMVYPSHYRRGEYNLSNPDLAPYETVYHSLVDAQKKLSVLQREQKVILRPWLQDFSLKNHYGREQLMAQIKAVEDAGLKEWIFWNPSNKYDLGKYRLETDDPKKISTPVSSGNPIPNGGLTSE